MYNKKADKSKNNLCFVSLEEAESRGRGGRNGCNISSNLRLLLFVLSVPVPAGPPVLRKEKALQGHGHGSQEQGEQVRRWVVQAVVRCGDLRGGERGGVGGRVQEAGEAQGAEQRGEGGAAVQGGGARRHALLAGEARTALQGRGPGTPQPRRERSHGVPGRAGIAVAAVARRLHRHGRLRAGRLHPARGSPDGRRYVVRGRRCRAVRRLRRARRTAGRLAPSLRSWSMFVLY